MEVPDHSHSGAHAVPYALSRWQRRPEVETEIRTPIALPSEALEARLRSCGTCAISGEALIYLIRTAIVQDDSALLHAALKALTRRTTRRLLSHARNLPEGERLEHPQEVLLQVYIAAQDGGAKIEYAEVNFNHYLKLRSIDQFRRRKNDFEVVNVRLDPTEASDLLENTVPDSGLSLEDRASIERAIERLPPKLKEVFLQRHYLGLRRNEIALQHGVTEQTVRNWLKQAQDIFGMSGGKHEA